MHLQLAVGTEYNTIIYDTVYTTKEFVYHFMHSLDFYSNVLCLLRFGSTLNFPDGYLAI